MFMDYDITKTWKCNIHLDVVPAWKVDLSGTFLEKA
jgi:hypothetical protein